MRRTAATAPKKKAAVKKAGKPKTRTTFPSERPAAAAKASATPRPEAAPDTDLTTPTEGHETAPRPDVQLPAATYDPTPDTHVPPRGQTSFQPNAQSERAAALKGQRARISSRRKN